jgi:hypothetical protein
MRWEVLGYRHIIVRIESNAIRGTDVVGKEVVRGVASLGRRVRWLEKTGGVGFASCSRDVEEEDKFRGVLVGRDVGASVSEVL